MSVKSIFSKIPTKWRPILLLGTFVLLAFIVLNNPPEIAKNITPKPPGVAVAVQQLESAPYRVILDSYGVVRPRTQSTLLPQVNGQVMVVAPNFREGGFFNTGDILITIDDRDFKAAVTAAEASLLDAERLLLEEQAQAKISERDWLRSGNKLPAPDLVLRKPQLKAAQAQLKSAQAALQTASLNLERTRIRAPYAGRVLSKQVDIGQVVSSNTILGEIYATDYVEIRLPLKNSDLAFIDLPENYRPIIDDDAAITETEALPAVKIQSSLTGQEEWLGHIVRVEGAIDEASQQLHVIAQIEDPYGHNNLGNQFLNKTPLKIGQYITAQITGNTIPKALVIPNATIYQGSFVYVVENGVIRRRSINIAWQNNREALIDDGLDSGEQLVMTPLGQIVSGTRAIISNAIELNTTQLTAE